MTEIQTALGKVYIEIDAIEGISHIEHPNIEAEGPYSWFTVILHGGKICIADHPKTLRETQEYIVSLKRPSGPIDRYDHETYNREC